MGEANNGSLYVDGSLVANNELNVPPAGNRLDVWIGGAPDYPGARLVSASVADVSVFAYSLTANQVTNLFNGTFVPGPNTLSFTPKTSGLELNWKRACSFRRRR